MNRAMILVGSFGLLSGFSGCVAGDPSPEPAVVTTVDSASLAEVRPGEQLVLDMRDANAVYVFDPAHGYIDEGRVRLFCPDGSLMGLRRWLTLRAEEIGDDPRGDGAWAIGARMEATRLSLLVQQVQQTDGCYEECHQCPDGLYTCRLRCPHEVERERRTVERHQDDAWLMWWLSQDDPEDPGPFNPFWGGGSGSGSSGSSGSGSSGSGSSGSGSSGSGSSGSGGGTPPGSGSSGQPPR